MTYDNDKAVLAALSLSYLISCILISTLRELLTECAYLYKKHTFSRVWRIVFHTKGLPKHDTYDMHNKSNCCDAFKHFILSVRSSLFIPFSFQFGTLLFCPWSGTGYQDDPGIHGFAPPDPPSTHLHLSCLSRGS